jgi:hypothetical protein
MRITPTTAAPAPSLDYRAYSVPLTNSSGWTSATSGDFRMEAVTYVEINFRITTAGFAAYLKDARFSQ